MDFQAADLREVLEESCNATRFQLCIFIGYARTRSANRDFPENEIIKDKLLRTYSIGDLPLWSKDGKKQDVDPLIRYLRSTVEPASWESQATRAGYYADKLSLVVSASADVHEKIAKALSQLQSS